MPKRFVLLLTLPVLAAGCAASGSHGVTAQRTPTQTGVSLVIRPDSGTDATRVVRAHGVSWFAAAANGTVHIYRWADGRWHEVGRVHGPLPGSGADSGLGKPVFLTGGGAPDFPVNAGGADTAWFEVISRIGGTWRAAKFDYADGPTAAIDARGVRGRLVRAQMNGCGCAAGPETYTWYRFNGRLFVPTTPPGPAPACSAAALTTAGRITGGFPDDPGFRSLGQPLSVSRFACADGWALASVTRQGRHELAVFEQHGRRWLEAAVAPAGVIERGIGIAIPNSLLSTLGARIHEHLSLPRPRSTGWVWPQQFVKQTVPTPPATPVRLVVWPGNLYYESWWGCCGAVSHRWLAVALVTNRRSGDRRATIHVFIYHWRHDHWVRKANLHVDFAPAHPEGPMAWFNETPLTGSKPRGFQLQTDTWPGWTAEIALVGGRWQVVPFDDGHTKRAAIEGVNGFASSGSAITGSPRLVYSPGPAALTAYRYRDGAFVPAWRRPFPSCSPHALVLRAGPGVRIAQSACAYGYALAVGTKNGRPVAIAFSDLTGGGWRWVNTVPRSRFASLSGAVPAWLFRILARRVDAG